jgi:hypothetical protein
MIFSLARAAMSAFRRTHFGGELQRLLFALTLELAAEDFLAVGGASLSQPSQG